jgi:hypothetical protein
LEDFIPRKNKGWGEKNERKIIIEKKDMVEYKF